MLETLVMKSRKKTNQTSDKNTFQVIDTKPLTNANNDASGSKQEDNDDAIRSMSSASNVEDAKPNDDNMFLQDLINHRKATNKSHQRRRSFKDANDIEILYFPTYINLFQSCIISSYCVKKIKSNTFLH